MIHIRLKQLSFYIYRERDRDRYFDLIMISTCLTSGPTITAVKKSCHDTILYKTIVNIDTF